MPGAMLNFGNLKSKKQPCRPNRLHNGRYIFENKSGIPITPYKEHMIDGSKSPNARGDRVSMKSVVIPIFLASESEKSISSNKSKIWPYFEK